MKTNHYSKNKHCKCGKNITNTAKRCQSCNIKYLFKIGKFRNDGRYNGMYKTGENCLKNLPKCLICNKKLTNPKAKHCALHARQISAKNPKRILKIKRTLCKHHIFGINEKEIMILTRSQHTKLHNNLYFYILNRYGKKAILNYIKWFKKNFIRRSK